MPVTSRATFLRRALWFLAFLSLFVISLELIKSGARPLTLWFKPDAGENVPGALGAGWLIACLVMSGSPVAALALGLLDDGSLTARETFAMVTGSRLGASFVVLVVGFVYDMRARRRGNGVYVGALALLTTFTIYLPRQSHEVAAESVPESFERGAIPRVGAGLPLAVVAEDEAAVRGLVARVLVEQGFEVLEAGDGADALELVARAHPDGRLRLVVTDLAMPRMGGRELAERLLDQGYRVPLLFITGYTEDDVERLGLLGNGDEVLRKPFTPEALADRARRLVSPPSSR